MDRCMLAEHLRKAERALQRCARHIERQHQIIEELESGGRGTQIARDLLRVFEQTQDLHVINRNRLVREMNETS